MKKIDIRDIPGFKIGQEQNIAAATGCTVVICEDGASCGVDVRGGSPGTRDTDALSPLCNRKAVHAVMLAGGSSFGLDAASGAASFLEERGIGRDVGVTRVPNVCAAILFDLKCGDWRIRPDAAMGRAACENAFAGAELRSGSFGAGTGATIGKPRGRGFAMKGGVGFAAFEYEGLKAGAVVAVNCVGDVVKDGRIIAGALADDGGFADSESVILENSLLHRDFFSGNTMLACIITNAAMDKIGAAKLAAHGHYGIARAVRPSHSIFDGDTVFAMSFGDVGATADAVGILARRAVEEAIFDAVENAGELFGYPSIISRRGGGL